MQKEDVELDRKAGNSDRFIESGPGEEESLKLHFQQDQSKGAG